MFLTFLFLLPLFIVFFLFRNNWVYKQRIDWINKDVYQYDRLAPSYWYMLFHFWIWDMHKFGLPDEQKTP